MLSIGEIAVIHAAQNNSTRLRVAAHAAELVGDIHFDEKRAAAILDRLLVAGYIRKDPDGSGFECTRRGQQALTSSVTAIRELLSKIW